MKMKKQKTSKISDFLNKNATWNSIIILLTLILLFNLLIFPFFHANNHENVILDAQFSYSSDKAYKIIANYNDAELKKYMIGQLTLDFVYPIVYTLFFSFFIFKLSRKSTLSLFPLLIMFSDYLENIGIVAIVNYYPQKLPNIVTITSLFTSLKWILVASSVLILLALLIRKFYTQLHLDYKSK